MDLQGRLVMVLDVYQNVLRKGKIIGKDNFSVTFF